MHGRWWVGCAGALAVAAVLAHAVTLGYGGLYGLFGNGVDAVVYRYGGGTVLEGQGLYTFSLFDTQLPFTYPPFAALVFVVLAVLPIASTMLVVSSLNVVLLYLAVLLCWRNLGYRGVRTHAVSVFLAVAFTWLEPVRMTLWLGQINLLLLVLVLWDLGRPDGSRLRGIGVGVAAGMKLTPAFFVLYALSLRQYRTVAVASATFVATVGAGLLVVFDDARTFWTSAIFQSDRIGLLASPANQSVRGALARAWPGHEPPVLVWMACSIALALVGLWCAVLAHRRGERLLGLTVCGLTTPVVSPFAWGHHWVWCVPLVVLVLHYATTTGARWMFGAAALLTAPFVAWYYTTSDGVAVIGTFMLPGPVWVREICTLAYPGVFVVLVVVVSAGWRWDRSHGGRANAAPGLELALERQRRVGRTGRGESTQCRAAVERTHMAQKTVLRLGAVEEDAVDRSVFVEESREIVGHDGRVDDGRIQASVSGTQFQHVPHGDAVA